MYKKNGFNIQQSFFIDEETLSMLSEMSGYFKFSKAAFIRTLIRERYLKFKGDKVRRASDK